MQLYDSSGAAVGSNEYFYISLRMRTSRTVTSGQRYYIKVSPSNTGTYKIGFNKTQMFPYPCENPILLSENTWADGNLTTANNLQWFSFTATANTHNIHFKPGTCTFVYAAGYDSSGNEVSSEQYLYLNASMSLTVTSGQSCYIKVRTYNSVSTGTYKIEFTKTAYPHDATIIPLSENTWADGNLLYNSHQWFSFSATASTQYIHFKPGTCEYVLVQLYDSSGITVGSQADLHSSALYASRTVTSGQRYYIKVILHIYSDPGTYKIGFNKTTTPPL